jgi:hypothetical protein
MAYKNILTYNARVSQVEQTYYSPTSVLPITGLPISSIYVFLSRIEPWANDLNPDTPLQTQRYIKEVFKNMFVSKLVNQNNISPVIERHDWLSGTTYNYYQDNIDMFEVDQNGFNVINYYVRNSYDQVFKCLWNNLGTPSTVEPYFQPGNYGLNNIFKGSDGYKWKYMYTIDVGTKKTFMDATWIPVPVGDNTPNPLQSAAGSGDIEVINVTNGGSGYDTANGAVTVTITGDGTGAQGFAVANGTGSITDIIVTNAGTNYSYATVTITSTIGSGATAMAPASPIGGHGFAPVDELGVKAAMITAEFDGSEGGYVPTDVDYRQSGILINPTSLENYPYPANGQIYSTSTDLVVSTGFGAFVSGETVYQGSVSSPTFTATMLSFNSTTNVVRLINIMGTPLVNLPIFGVTSQTARTILTYNTPNFVPFSGYLSQIQNRSGIERSPDGIEQFRFVLGY